MPLLHALLSLIALILVIATLPLVLELFPLSLAALLPAKRPAPAADVPLRLTVVVPAHNEERLIAQCVRSLVAASADPSVSNVEVLVVAHNCTDATASMAQAAGAQVWILDDEVGGKGTALNYAFTHALGSGTGAVLVIDADSTVSPNLIAATLAALASGSRALQCRYIVANPGATARTHLMNLAFFGMNVLRPRGRARLGLSCGIFGNGFALSADTLRRVPYHANSLVEDREYHLNLVRSGIRVDFLDHAQVLGEMPDNSDASSTQRARWEGGRILMRREWTFRLLADVFAGRMRMIEPLLDLRSLPLATEAIMLIGSLLLTFVGPLVWLRVYAAFGLGTLVLYLLVAARLGPEPVETLKALAAAPGYMVWKLAMIPRTRVAARKDSAWIRTQRNETSGLDE